MSIATLSIRKPVTILMIYALVIAVTAALIPSLGIDMFPETEMPFLHVSTTFAGANPEDVEKNVTIPIEQSLSSIEGLRNISSTSSEGRSSITLEFGYDVDLDDVKADIESQLNAMRDSLPDDAETPVVRSFDMSQMPIMRLVIRGDRGATELKSIAEEILQPRLERIPGVASAEVTGGKDRIVKIEVSLNRLEAYGIELSTVVSVLASQNLLLSAGYLERGGTEFQVRTDEKLGSLEEIRRIVVTTAAGSDTAASGTKRVTAVRLEDIASVSLGYDDSGSEVYINGTPGIYIQIQNESDSNSVRVARAVKSALAELNDEIPEGITVEVLSDDTTMIESTLNMVYRSAWQGAILAMLILFLFLRNIKSTLIVGLSIPISICITLSCMAYLDLTLNMMTLTGLILGLGMTVDGAIVILDNIHRYRERGAKPDVAAVLGSQEMITAITASTLTTLCVFVPVLIFGDDLEMMGQMFRELVLTVIISLTASLCVAMPLVPVLPGPILKMQTRIQKPLRIGFLRKIDDLMERAFARLERGYAKGISFCLDNRVLVGVLVLALLALSGIQFSRLGFNLFVRSNADDTVSVSLTMPLGTPKARTREVLERYQEIIKETVKDYRTITLQVGSGGMGGESSTSNAGSIRIALPPVGEQTENPARIIAKLRPLFSDVPGAQVTFSAGRRMGDSSAVDVIIETDDMDSGLRTAEKVRSVLAEQLPQVIDPEISLSAGSPDLRVRIDRERAYALGVSMSKIASAVRTALYGSTATTYTGEGDEIDVVVSLKEEDRATAADLYALFVTNNAGTKIPLANVATLVEGNAPSKITREDEARVIHVTGDLAADVAVTDMQGLVQQVITANVVPEEGVTISFGGESQEMSDMLNTLILIALFAVFLVFAVMASQFESLVDPFIIFFSIPLIVIGVVLIYTIWNEPFSLFSAVGLVALVGVVVNNGIVLVDYTNTLRARGRSVREACGEAGGHRLRAILMTTLTTILSMVPLAFGSGEATDQVQPIAKTMVGGLAVSSIMTLFVTPVVYSLLNSGRERRRLRRTEKMEKRRKSLLAASGLPAEGPAAALAGPEGGA